MKVKTESEAVDILIAILAGRQFEDPDVCDDKSAAGSFERDFDELEVCNKGESTCPFRVKTIILTTA